MLFVMPSGARHPPRLGFLDAVKANQQWYVEHGDVKNPIDVDKIYDPQYLDYAVSTLGKR